MRTPSDRLKLFAGIVITTLLLVIGYRRPTGRTVPGPTPDSAQVATQSASVPAAAPDTSAVATVPASLPATERLKEPPKTPPPTRPAVPTTPPQTVSPEPISTAAEPAPKPASAPCAQIILRSGDLFDAHVTEIGTREVRYRKCHWPDGPEHVILRADVLSIRFANGEIERL